MVITYGAQVSATYHRYQSTQSNPELCFILVPNSRELEGYSLEKIGDFTRDECLGRLSGLLSDRSELFLGGDEIGFDLSSKIKLSSRFVTFFEFIFLGVF
jgi:hypothetical protein